tara:strand:+ start:84 stop:539 length:456 start_codon:yes stop_codon:yes gene_type:complete
MNELSIELNWDIGDGELIYGKYHNDHTIKINDQILVEASSAPEYGGNKRNLNPEQALAASVSSCHMMTFLALASKMKWPIKSYFDKAVAYIGKNKSQKMCVIKIELNPYIEFKDGFSVSNEEMLKMQDRAHRYCFIANSLSDEVEILINQK